MVAEDSVCIGVCAREVCWLAGFNEQFLSNRPTEMREEGRDIDV